MVEGRREQRRRYLSLGIMIFSMLGCSIGQCVYSVVLLGIFYVVIIYWSSVIVILLPIGFSIIFGSVWPYYQKVSTCCCTEIIVAVN